MISKNLPSNINSSHIGKPRSWWKTTLHYQLHPGAHGKIHRTPEGFFQPKVEMLGNHEVYGISSTGNSIHQRVGCGSLRARPAYRGIKTPKHDNSRILWPKYISVINITYIPPKK